jgi:hypothetical protein
VPRGAERAERAPTGERGEHGSASPAPATPPAGRAWHVAASACKHQMRRHTPLCGSRCAPETPPDPIGRAPRQVERNLADAGAESKAPLKYALVIDGKALLYALSPMLRQLFLKVGRAAAARACCSCWAHIPLNQAKGCCKQRA